MLVRVKSLKASRRPQEFQSILNTSNPTFHFLLGNFISLLAWKPRKHEGALIAFSHGFLFLNVISSQVNTEERRNLQTQGLLFMERKRNCRSNTCKIDLVVDNPEYVNTLLAVTNNPSAARRFQKKEKHSLYHQMPV